MSTTLNPRTEGLRKLPGNSKKRSAADYFGPDREHCNQRLGNMALLNSISNQNISQRPFDPRKKPLVGTNYKGNQTLENYQKWSAGSVEDRQGKLANIMLEVWKID